MKNLDAYVDHILNDYKVWMNLENREDDIAKQVALEMINRFKIEVEQGSKYLKIVHNNGTQRSVHSFICRKDNGKFKTGDILKAAGWAAPAKNFARGNILEGNWSNVRWTGA